jgi:hypothetical protein
LHIAQRENRLILDFGKIDGPLIAFHCEGQFFPERFSIVPISRRADCNRSAEFLFPALNTGYISTSYTIQVSGEYSHGLPPRRQWS